MKDEYAAAMIDWQDTDAIKAAIDLIVSVFDDPLKYSRQRIASELTPLSPPHDRRFFAIWIDGRMAGVGGVKSADWASNTHILYLSAVDAAYRGQGIGRALIEARIAWVQGSHANGRILVSTMKHRRYRRLGFSGLPSHHSESAKLMYLDYS